MTIYCGDACEMLATLEPESVQCGVTSPPYWRLRDYGVEGQLGLEATPEEYVAAMVRVFRAVRRVLRRDGVLWLNLGDSYSSGGNGSRDPKRWPKQSRNDHRIQHAKKKTGVPSKSLLLLPAKVAIALQEDGWVVRQENIWHKPSPMPESVQDRPTRSHEMVYLLTKSPSYFYDAEAVKEPAVDGDHPRSRRPRYQAPGQAEHTGLRKESATRNLRTVWTIPSRGFSEAHFATFPPALVGRCIKAGTSARGCCPRCGAPWTRVVDKAFRPQPDVRNPVKLAKSSHKGLDASSGWGELPRGTTKTTTMGWRPGCECACSPVPCVVLDPFLGSGTTGMVAESLGRRWVGIELNPEYCEIAKRRISGPLFAEVER